MACRGSPLSWSLSGVKRTSPIAAHMSAYDPKRTWVPSGYLSGNSSERKVRSCQVGAPVGRSTL